MTGRTSTASLISDGDCWALEICDRPSLVLVACGQSGQKKNARVHMSQVSGTSTTMGLMCVKRVTAIKDDFGKR